MSRTHYLDKKGGACYERLTWSVEREEKGVWMGMWIEWLQITECAVTCVAKAWETRVMETWRVDKEGKSVGVKSGNILCGSESCEQMGIVWLKLLQESYPTVNISQEAHHVFWFTPDAGKYIYSTSSVQFCIAMEFQACMQGPNEQLVHAYPSVLTHILQCWPKQIPFKQCHGNSRA